MTDQTNDPTKLSQTEISEIRKIIKVFHCKVGTFDNDLKSWLVACHICKDYYYISNAEYHHERSSTDYEGYECYKCNNAYYKCSVDGCHNPPGIPGCNRNIYCATHSNHCTCRPCEGYDSDDPY